MKNFGRVVWDFFSQKGVQNLSGCTLALNYTVSILIWYGPGVYSVEKGLVGGQKTHF